MPITRFLSAAVFVLLFTSPLVPSAQAQSVSQAERICGRVERRFSANPRIRDRAYERIEARMGIRCHREHAQAIQKIAIANNETSMVRRRISRRSLRGSTSLNAITEEGSGKREKPPPAPEKAQVLFADAIDSLQGSLLDKEFPVYTQAEFLSNALDAYEYLYLSTQSTVISDLTEAAFNHFSKLERRKGRVRYENNLARLIAFLKQSDVPGLKNLVRAFLEESFYAPEPFESKKSFALRKEAALALWDDARIVLYYWPGTPQAQNTLQEHFDLLVRIRRARLSGFPPGSDYLHLIIMRDDVGATASEGTIFLTTRATFRSFIHEVGHAVHLTHPSIVASFEDFARLHRESRSSEDFATTYHTNFKEDFAELYTEYVLSGTKQEHPLDRALRQSADGNSLLLEKILYIFLHLFDSSKDAVKSYYFLGDEVRAIDLLVRRKLSGKIEALRWDGNWHEVE